MGYGIRISGSVELRKSSGSLFAHEDFLPSATVYGLGVTLHRNSSLHLIRKALQTSARKLLIVFEQASATFAFINIICILLALAEISWFSCLAFASEIKEPNVAGQFYLENKETLSQQIDTLLNNAKITEEIKGDIFCLISPHAGYSFSGQTAAFGYKLIKNMTYTTVVIIGPTHHYSFKGISVYAQGKFRTPLGDLDIDSEFAQKLIDAKESINFNPEVFNKEHSVEVQLPFLQKTLAGFKIVPIITGDCDFKTLENLAANLAKVIGERKDVLLVASTDLMHSNDYEETEMVDKITLSYLEKMSPEDIYGKLRDGTIGMCGGLPVVAAVIAAKKMNHNKLIVLRHTNSAEVTGRKIKGLWTVGYLSAVIDQEKKEEVILNTEQQKRLLEIARKTISEYVKSGKRLDFKEEDSQLKTISGAFVTLHKDGALRGCIGNIIGQKPLFETARDMAIESATADPRFPSVTKEELEDIEIEISVLSPLKKISDINEFELGTHGVLIRKGWNQGVFLPQVAAETGWSKEEFLSNLCAHKAGLPADSWKDAATEIFIFSAFVFSEKDLK